MLARDPAQRPSAKQIAQFLEAEAARQNPDSSSDRATAQAGTPDLVKPRPLWKEHQKLVWISALMVLAAVIGWIAFLQIRKPAALAELAIHPLTAQPGYESRPALSPDGKSVAFTWTSDLTQAPAIYLKRLDSEAPVLLFRLPSGELIGALAWSPDNSKLAFKTENGQGGEIWVVPANGGTSVKVTNLGNGNLSSSIDWSPGGSRIVFSDCWRDCEHLAIFSLDLRTSRRQRLTAPPLSDWGDWDPKYSPDGTQIAFKRVSGFWRDALYVMPSTGGSVRRLA
jgi:dipeptidyl aminopeptidase/acylaminoacyl peptidase